MMKKPISPILPQCQKLNVFRGNFYHDKILVLKMSAVINPFHEKMIEK